MTYISWFNDFALYPETFWWLNLVLWDNESKWCNSLPHTTCNSQCPVYHGPVILLYYDGWASYFVIWVSVAQHISLFGQAHLQFKGCLVSLIYLLAYWWAGLCRRPHSLNIFSSETTEPVNVKSHMELLWDGGTKVSSNGPGHMIKVATMPIYGKNFKKSSSPEPKGRWPWNLVCSIGCLSTTKSVQMMTLDWSWPILWQG